jgi:hypothetical protein
MLQAGRLRVRVPMRCIFFNLSNPSSRIMVLGSTQPLTEMKTRNFLGWGEGRPALKSDNITAIYSRCLEKMWEPRRLTILWAFTASYRDNFTFHFYIDRIPTRIRNSLMVFCIKTARWSKKYAKKSQYIHMCIRILCRSKRCFSSSQCPDRLCDPRTF